MITQLVLSVAVAVIVSALCSLLEAILYSISWSRIEVLLRAGRPSGRILQKLKSDIHRPIIAILTLNTVANTMGAAVAGAAAAAVFGEQRLVWFSAAFTVTILIFSEILPKTVGVAYNRQLAPMAAFPVLMIVRLLTPVIWLIQYLTMTVNSRNQELLVSAEEVQAIAALSRKAGGIDREEEKVINNIINLKNMTVRQAMTPRSVTFAMSTGLTVDEARNNREDWERHSRVPVYDRNPDDIVGIVLRKDVLLSAADENEQRTLREIMHPAHFVPESAPLNRILLQFFEHRRHLFVVVDEFGGIAGVISLEDIIEEIVGREIVDETDRTTNMQQLARERRQLFQQKMREPEKTAPPQAKDSKSQAMTSQKVGNSGWRAKQEGGERTG